MASTNTRKTWETAFLLSASMSDSYQKTFDQAQQIMKDLGLENIQLGDEAERAAQRQENAITMAAAAIAEAGLTELLVGIKDAYSDIIQVTMEFEYTMSAVEALSGATAGEVAELEEKARMLGETTVFTARESAQAMTYMAQAGWDTIEMLEGMDGVISLAAASGTDLAETSSIVADTLAGFGMAADETGRLADVLAQAASHSNTNVSLMGQTFANSAALAGALGFKIEDVSAILGIMANNGIKGSRAGTTLRNILNGLAADATLTAEAFGEITFSMFDENGNAKELIPVVRELRDYFSQMTEQEKFLNAKDIAGMRGYNGLLAILNTTDEQFEEMYADIENANGAAKKMADTRLDNLQGDVTLLNSAFESLKITIGEELDPAGRAVVERLTSAVQWAGQFIEMHPNIVTGLNMVAGGIGGVVTALAAGAAAIKGWTTIKIILSLFGAGAAAPVVAGLGAAAGIMTALIVKASAIEKEARDIYRETFDAAESMQAYASTYEENARAWKESIDAIESEAGNTEYLIGRLDQLYSAQNKTLSQKQEILSIVNLLNEAVPELALAYDAEADSLNLTADAIRERARAEAEAELMAEKQEKLKERIKAQNELEQNLSDTAQMYNEAKAEYERVYAEQMESQSKWMGEERAAKSMEYNRYVVAAKDAMDDAQNAMLRLMSDSRDNQWWIDELAREISGEERTSGQSSGGGGSPEEHAILAAERYAEDIAELSARLSNRKMLEKNLLDAEKRLEEDKGLYKSQSEAAWAYSNSGILKPVYGTTKGSERLDYYAEAYRKSQEEYEYAKNALTENEAAIAELTEAAERYEGAIQTGGGDVNVVTTITIEGNASEETAEEIGETVRDVVRSVLDEEERKSSRVLYTGGE